MKTTYVLSFFLIAVAAGVWAEDDEVAEIRVVNATSDDAISGRALQMCYIYYSNSAGFSAGSARKAYCDSSAYCGVSIEMGGHVNNV